MSDSTPQSNWRTFVENELNTIRPILAKRGYSFSAEQPHTKGERFLMKNITTTSGEKLILLGADKQSNRVVIKATRDETGKQELEHERKCRALLQDIDFSYTSFDAPKEVAFWSESGYMFAIQNYVDQACNFLDRSLEEQFIYALNALNTQAGARITTNSHLKKVGSVFGIRKSSDYIRLLNAFITSLQQRQVAPEILATVESVLTTFKKEKLRIEQYCGFLTHTDFVPHNFRIANNIMYLLDWSSLEFGNKHESWARFLNFMTLYNPQLETLLIDYIDKNRSFEERESLQLMRLYRLCELITYYANTLTSSSDDLLELNQVRVYFWHNVLKAELQNKRVDRSIVARYQNTRDKLRSSGEKERQRNLH